MKFIKYAVPLCVSVGLLNGCAGVVLGGVASVGYLAAQERGQKAAVMDTKIKIHIKDRLTNAKYTFLKDVEVTVLQGQVVLMGVVANRDDARQVERVAGTVPGVKTVYNELYTNGKYPAEQFAKDSWVATQVRTKLLSTKDVYSINYDVNVVNGRVYIVGLAESQSEMERVLHIARTTKGAKDVRNYIRYREDSWVDSTPESMTSPDELAD